MSTANQASIKPLFGDGSDSFFGDKMEFCRNIVVQLELTIPRGLSLQDDPDKILATYSKEAVLQLSFDKQMGLDELLPLSADLKTEEVALLAEQAAHEGAQVVSSEGVLPAPAVIVRVLLQFQALDEVCKPIQDQEWSAEKLAFMKNMKAKLDKIAGSD